MTQYETIKRIRNVIKVNGGATVTQIAHVTSMEPAAVTYALKVMGDAYIDRWDGSKPVYDVIETPLPCPKPH